MMHIPEPCLCGAPDCPRCFPGCHKLEELDCGHEEHVCYVEHCSCGAPICRKCTECQLCRDDREHENL